MPYIVAIWAIRTSFNIALFWHLKSIKIVLINIVDQCSMNKMSLVEDKQIKEITTTIIENLGSNIDEAQYEVCGSLTM